MKRTKAMILMACICAVVLVAAGCGGSDGSSTEGSGDAEINGTITIWDLAYNLIPPYTTAIDQIDDEFEAEYPDVKVKRVQQPEEGYPALVRTAFLSGEVPDVMVMSPGANGTLSFTEGLEVLNDRISPELQDTITQWGSATEGFTEEGEHYGVPYGMNGFVFYYNKKLFAKAGLPTDFEPQSWDEVRETGEKLKAAGIQPFTGGNKEGGPNEWWVGFGLQTENTPEESTELYEGKISWTDPRIAKAFGPMIEMQEAGLFPDDSFSTGYAEGYAEFAEGEAAMTLGFWSIVGYWGEFVPTIGEENLGMFQPPGGAPLGPYAAITYTIPEDAENKDAAWAFLEFLASKKSGEILADVGEYLPNRRDVPLPPGTPAQAKTLVEESRTKESAQGPTTKLRAAVVEVLVAELSEVLQGRKSLEEAQQVIQEASERSIASS